MDDIRHERPNEGPILNFNKRSQKGLIIQKLGNVSIKHLVSSQRLHC